MNCSRAQFPVVWVKLCFESNRQMWNILLFSCLPHTKACTCTFIRLLTRSMLDRQSNPIFASSPFFDWTCLVTQLLLIATLACIRWKVVFKIGEHCQFMVNKTADVEHCYLFHECIVIFLILNTFTTKVGGEFKLSSQRSSWSGNRCTEFTYPIEFFTCPGQAGNR